MLNNLSHIANKGRNQNNFLKIFIYLLLEKGEVIEKEKETNITVWLPTGDLAHNPGMCPDWEMNQQPFCLQAGTQSTEPHQPGLESE